MGSSAMFIYIKECYLPKHLNPTVYTPDSDMTAISGGVDNSKTELLID